VSVALKTVCRYKIRQSFLKKARFGLKKIRSNNETVYAGLAMAMVNMYVATGYEF
jgi:hypothetical protein